MSKEPMLRRSPVQTEKRGGTDAICENKKAAIIERAFRRKQGINAHYITLGDGRYIVYNIPKGEK